VTGPPQPADLSRPRNVFPVGPWALTLTALLAFAAYVDTLTYTFVWDDAMMVGQNWRLRDPANLWQLLQADFTVLTSGLMEGRYYRPVAALSLAFDLWFWGPVPAPFHLTSVLLHATVSVLVGCLALGLGAGKPIAVLAALGFALHPAHAEAVAFVSARSDLLPTVAILGCLIAYRKAAGGGTRGLCWSAGTTVLLLAAMLAKESAIVLPALMSLSDLLFPVKHGNSDNRKGKWNPIIRSLPFWGVTAVVAVWRLPSVHHLAGDRLTWVDLWHRLPGSLEILARYAGLTVLPNHMQPYYSLQRPHAFADPGPLLGLLTVGILCVLVAWTWRRAPVVAFGAAWFLVATLPVLDLVPLSFREMGLADRYLYLPSVGWSFGLAWGLAAVFGKGGGKPRSVRRSIGWIGVTTMCVLYSWWLLRYVPVWQDNFALYTRMEQVAPWSPTPSLNLGLAYFRANDLPRATQSLERAVRLNPALQRPRAILALLYVLQGRPTDGFRLLFALGAEGATDRDYYVARATAHLEAGDVSQAAAVAEAGARLHSGDATLRELWARALDAADRPAEAVARYREALTLNPDLAQAEENLARLYLRMGDATRAEHHLRRSIEILPERPQPLRELALLREAQGNGVESLHLWRDVLSLAPNGTVVREALHHIRRLENAGFSIGPAANTGKHP
jgi:protein O-mannosyl-transferase